MDRNCATNEHSYATVTLHMKHKLYIDSIAKSFDLNRVLSDVYLTCETGEIIGLLGRNGSGKSTLLKIIFGTLQADTKFIKIDKKQINKLSDAKGMLQYLPQYSFLPSHCKVTQLIDLLCNKKQAILLSQHTLIQNLAKQKVRELSGGEQRLLEVLLLIHSDSLFTLIDEPFNGIAPVHREEIKNCIHKASEYKGFIITDHDYHNILDISTRLILLHDGDTKHLKTPKELIHWGYLNNLE